MGRDEVRWTDPILGIGSCPLNRRRTRLSIPNHTSTPCTITPDHPSTHHNTQETSVSFGGPFAFRAQCPSPLAVSSVLTLGLPPRLLDTMVSVRLMPLELERSLLDDGDGKGLGRGTPKEGPAEADHRLLRVVVSDGSSGVVCWDVCVIRY